LTAAGIISFVVGALVLFNSPGTPSFLRVSVPLVIGVAFVSAVFFMTVVTFAIRAQRRPIETGAESLIGRTGEVRSDLAPDGMVQIGGELWSAFLDEGYSDVQSGERVEVLDVDGLRLRVRPLQK
jgi:membrane-bound serine protease (ClpP class)